MKPRPMARLVLLVADRRGVSASVLLLVVMLLGVSTVASSSTSEGTQTAGGTPAPGADPPGADPTPGDDPPDGDDPGPLPQPSPPEGGSFVDDLVAGLAQPQSVAADDDPVGVAPQFAGSPWFFPGAIYNQNFPDPTIVWNGGRFWALATSTGGPMLPVMWSTDLRTWTARSVYSPNPWNSDPWFNDAMVRPPDWSYGGVQRFAGKDQWGPGIVPLNGRWVAYTSWQERPGRRCVSAAIGPSPQGPFFDPLAAPLQCDFDAAGSIDPAPFIDDNGVPYLLWKSEGGPSYFGWQPARIWARQLNPDGLSFAPAPPAVLMETAWSWELPRIENPSMVRFAGGLYLLYSANRWDSVSYAMGVARCAGPLGPCERTRATPLIPNSSTQWGPGGGSFMVDTAGRLKVAYHAWNPPYWWYPWDPNCDAPGLCASQGQRLLRIATVVPWAGSLTVDPVGSLDRVGLVGPGQVGIAGWALDPNSAAPTEVHVYVDGRFGGRVMAGDLRGDVERVYPGWGARRGFSVALPMAAGVRRVCAYGINVGAGSVNTRLGCANVLVGGDPVGSLDRVGLVGPGQVGIAGWALDPDTAAPAEVHVYVDGRFASVLLAGGVRRDVERVYPGWGASRGFSGTLPMAAGVRRVCAYGINVGAGSVNTRLGCANVLVGGDPVGSLDRVGLVGPGQVGVAGWALDPDTAAPSEVHVYVDGRFASVLLAGGVRRDVERVYPGWGALRGFSGTLPMAAGVRRVCAYGINVGAGSVNTPLGCANVAVQ